MVKSFARRIPVAFRLMVQSKVWKARLPKPSQPYLQAISTEELACELVNLIRRKQKAKHRLKLLLKLSGCVITGAAFNRMHGEATDEIAQSNLAIMNLKSEIKRRGVKL